MKVFQMNEDGFETEEDFFNWDEHRKLFFLHENSVKTKRRRGENI